MDERAHQWAHVIACRGVLALGQRPPLTKRQRGWGVDSSSLFHPVTVTCKPLCKALDVVVRLEAAATIG